MTSVEDRGDDRARRVVWSIHADEAGWVAASVEAMTDALRAGLADGRMTWLLLSGGTTPAPAYRALAGQPLDWSRVVDDVRPEPSCE